MSIGPMSRGVAVLKKKNDYKRLTAIAKKRCYATIFLKCVPL